MTEQTTSLGVFDLDSEAETASLINKLKRRSGRLEVVLRPWRARRSNAQNRYYWGVVMVYCAFAWKCTAEDAHERVKLQFCGVPKFIAGAYEIHPGSTADLDTAQFKQLLEAIQKDVAAEYNVYIPDPNEPIFDEDAVALGHV